ncbi:ADP-ribosylglycohydrolase family protein [Thermodesulforhabdus norvegica]|uniref:ADP-ribosylglycohydrolase family protein n=1 Tax=Thermodesulforhabdus norvegica TaxID=39841 RepID=UPI0015A58FFF|nr:ADP-ribosylglycohydrolase family protein [Thermodesulforhabdus norvegica]
MCTKVRAEKFTGCLLGLALGDALGAPFEGRYTVRGGEIEKIASSLELLRYTDDTHMAIGVAESLIACRGLDGEHMAKTFVRNFRKEPWRGYGPGPPEVFRRIESGIPWYSAAEEVFPGGSYGNGAAMRIAPVGLFYHRNPEKIREAAYLCSRITHTHPLAKDGAVVIAAAVAFAVVYGSEGRRSDLLDYLSAFSLPEVYRSKLGKIPELALRGDRREVVRELGNGVEAFNSVPTAVYCFLTGDSFEKTVTGAISLGGDCDTIAAMAGAIAGAWWGIEAIPSRWLEKLENAEYIKSLARKIYKLTVD